MAEPISCANLLLAVANKRENISVKDFLRFNFDVWPLPDSTLDQENKYFIQKYVKLTPEAINLFNELLTMGTEHDWNLDLLKSNLYDDLLAHTELLKHNDNLSDLVNMHTGSPLSIKTVDGQTLNKYLKNISITHNITIFRTLDKDYYPSLKIGEITSTRDIWSTSYDPLSSLAYGLSDPDITNIYILRCRLKAGFKGGVFVENNFRSDVVKDQHEFIMAAGTKFKVNNILLEEVRVFDDDLNIEIITCKIYDILIL